MKAETQFKNLYDIREYFSDETICREYLERFRWNGVPVCPFCNCDKVYKLKNGKSYKCSNKDCKKIFSVTVGTIFENTKIPLSKWFLAMYLITAHKKGISSLQLSRDVGVTQKTAWFINHRIREMLIDKAPELLSNIVEIDETYVGGKDRFKHNSKKTGRTQGRSVKDKTVMFGLLERKGRVVAYKIPNAQRTTLIPLIENSVKKGSIVITDEHYAYRGISSEYEHLFINHAQDNYVNGVAHTNSIEGFWSLFKRGIIGIYHNVSEKHINRYLVEFAQRYNTRKTTESDRFNYFLSNCEGRIKYQDLIKD
ncbi:MAG: IS1595 family transposase [Alphaproteobacteria bacterium]|nr:IS1595 family transposase [Alphaproteobacteria bacterium]